MARHAVVDESGKVINCIEWDGAPWSPPLNHKLIKSDKADIGDIYDFQTKTFQK